MTLDQNGSYRSVNTFIVKVNNWSAINVIDNCLGCFDEFGVFYDLGSEIFASDDDCSFIFCEKSPVWSDTIYSSSCDGSGCYSDVRGSLFEQWEN